METDGLSCDVDAIFLYMLDLSIKKKKVILYTLVIFSTFSFQWHFYRLCNPLHQFMVVFPILKLIYLFPVLLSLQALDAKVIIFKKKRRKNYRRTKGHRQVCYKSSRQIYYATYKLFGWLFLTSCYHFLGIDQIENNWYSRNWETRNSRGWEVWKGCS